MEQSFKATNGQYYNLSPLTLGDLRRFTQYVQYREWQAFQDLQDRLPEAEFSAESRRLLQEASKRNWNESTPEVQAMYNTLEGSAYIVYLSLRRNHPTLTYNEVTDLVTASIINDVAEKLVALSGASGSVKKKK